MTELPPSPTAEQKAAAAHFARSLRDPAVRQQLKDHGFDGNRGDVILPVQDGESLQEASRRQSPDGARALRVRPDETQPAGWAMTWAVPA